MKQANKIILIGFADALSAPEVAWCLLENGFRVAAFIRHGHKPILSRISGVSIFEITAPEEDLNQSLRELKKIYHTSQAVAIMPLNDKAIWLSDKLTLESDVIVTGGVGEAAKFALDKRMQIKAAIQSGFKVPHTTIIEKPDDICKLDKLPVVIKPALAVAEVGGKFLKKVPLSYCMNKKELDQAIESWDKKQPLLAQPICKGSGEGIFGLATKDGIQAWSAHRRVRMMNPKGSGSSACKAIPIEDHPVQSAAKMLAEIKWQGMFMVELLRDDANNIWFVELNGRSWGSMALALRMGFEYPAWTVMNLFDDTFIPADPAPKNFVTCRNLGREILHLLQVLRGAQFRGYSGLATDMENYFFAVPAKSQ